MRLPFEVGDILIESDSIYVFKRIESECYIYDLYHILSGKIKLGEPEYEYHMNYFHNELEPNGRLINRKLLNSKIWTLLNPEFKTLQHAYSVLESNSQETV